MAKPALNKVVPPPPLARMIVPQGRAGRRSFARGGREIGNCRASHADGGAGSSRGRAGGACNRAKHGDLAQTRRGLPAFRDGAVGESVNTGGTTTRKWAVRKQRGLGDE